MQKTDKRQRLIDAAAKLLIAKGFAACTFADVAKESGVPLGNIYYYFKRKEDLVTAVGEHLRAWTNSVIDSCDEVDSPEQRIIKFIEGFSLRSESYVQYGCSIGSYCRDANKMGGAIAEQGRAVVQPWLEWLQAQFAALGYSKQESAEISIHIVANLNGTLLLGHIFADEKLIQQQVKRLCDSVQLDISAGRASGD